MKFCLIFFIIGFWLTLFVKGQSQRDVKNFKFRRRQVAESDFDNPPDLRRYFDDDGNILSFGYKLPEKSYAIFKLPPLPGSASPGALKFTYNRINRPPQNHQREFNTNKFMLTKNLNRARKMISTLEIENANKLNEILIKVKPSSVKVRQILQENVNEKSPMSEEQSSNLEMKDFQDGVHPTLKKAVSVRISPDPRYLLASEAKNLKEFAVIRDKYSVTKEITHGIPDSHEANSFSGIKAQTPVPESTSLQNNYVEQSEDLLDDEEEERNENLNDDGKIINQLVSNSVVINVTLVDQSFLKNISSLNSADEELEYDKSPEVYEDEYEYYYDEDSNITKVDKQSLISKNESSLMFKEESNSINSKLEENPLFETTILVELDIKNESIPRHKKEIENSKCTQDDISKMKSLKLTFPDCHKFTDCDTSLDFSGFGHCLVKEYPNTRSLTLAQTLTSGGGTVQFGSDEECTDFVHLFFPLCRSHIPSCQTVQRQNNLAILVLGCLFSQYTNLMVPLMSIGKEPQN